MELPKAAEETFRSRPCVMRAFGTVYKKAYLESV